MSYEQILLGNSVANSDTGQAFAQKINGNFEQTRKALERKTTIDEAGKAPAALRADALASPVSISLIGDILSDTGTFDGDKSVTLDTVVAQIPGWENNRAAGRQR